MTSQPRNNVTNRKNAHCFLAGLTTCLSSAHYLSIVCPKQFESYQWFSNDVQWRRAKSNAIGNLRGRKWHDRSISWLWLCLLSVDIFCLAVITVQKLFEVIKLTESLASDGKNRGLMAFGPLNLIWYKKDPSKGTCGSRDVCPRPVLKISVG